VLINADEAARLLLVQPQLSGNGCARTARQLAGSSFFPSDQRLLAQIPDRGDGVRLLTVGRLVEKNGAEFGIRAVAEIARERPGVEYKIVGTGPLHGELSKLIEELGAGSHIRLLGGLEQSEVARTMSQAHALLTPSVTAGDGNQEGIPVVLMEAMATGLPVISTYHSGIPELVEHDVSGLLVPERDVVGLVTEIRRLLSTRDLYQRITASAREKIEQHFDTQKLNDRLVEIHREASGSRRAPGTAVALRLAPPASRSDRYRSATPRRGFSA
jgi:glycosyltransferase involved in cell wall biosynthesis